MDLTTIGAFLLVATVAYVTPGPDWFVVMRHAARSRKHGYAAAVGVQTGLVVHISAAALGVAALLLSSAQAFTALKLAGALYLAYLGVRALLDARARARTDRTSPTHPLQHPGEPEPGLVTVWRQAFVANVLSPKAALFFVAVLPQFLDPAGAVAAQVLLLGALDIALGLVWWVALVHGVRAASSVLGATRARVVVDRVAGAALIALAGVLAASPRRTL